MTAEDRAYWEEHRRAYRAERLDVPVVTPEEGAALRKRYPVDGSDTPDDYKRLTAEEFFDG